MDNSKLNIKEIPNEIIILAYHLTFKNYDYFYNMNTAGSIEKHDELLGIVTKDNFTEWYRSRVNEIESEFEETIKNLVVELQEQKITEELATTAGREARNKKVEQLSYIANISSFRSQFLAQLEDQIENSLKTFEEGTPLLFANGNDRTNLIYCRKGQVYECSHNKKRIDFYYDESMKRKYDILLGKIEPESVDDNDDDDDDSWGGK